MKRILIFTGVLLFAFMSIAAYGQTIRITGTVTDAADGSGIPGASIVVKGTTTGVISDIDGNYEINAAPDATLVISFVGYTTIEVPVDGRNVINVELTSEAIGLEEVIVVAYGTTTRASFTGSASVVSGEKLQTIQSSNISSALEGMAAGVQVTSATGQPGSESVIRIRGVGSMSSSNRPLIVLDGVPYDGSLNSINPSDIESINVMKDAASSALYGARGANGVIIITTKKGKDGVIQVNFDTRAGINTRGVPEYNIMNAPDEYLEAYWQAIQMTRIYENGDTPEDAALFASERLFGTGGYLGGYNPYDVEDHEVIDPETGKLNPDANLLYHDSWQDEMFADGYRVESNLNVSGGVENTNYRFSFGQLSDDGFVVGSDFKRYTARLSIDQEITDWLKGGMTSSYTQSEMRSPVGTFATNYSNAFMFTRMVAPIYPVYQRDSVGDYLYDPTGNRIYDYGNMGNPPRPYAQMQNPVATWQEDINLDTRDNTAIQGYLETNFLENFSFTANASYTAIGREDISFMTPLGGDAAEFNGRGYRTNTRTTSLNTNQLLRYSNVFGAHSVDVLVGHESYQWNYSYLFGHKTNFFLPDNPQLENATNMQGLGSYTQDYSVEGYLSRLEYNYDNKYYANASYRRDGSSRFHPDNRWGNFWSAGVSWRINQENFLANIEWIDDLKLKASFGEQGNDALTYPRSATQNYLPYINQYEVARVGESIGISRFYTGNPDITWETNRNLNAGIDFGLFNRMSGTIEYFQRLTEDMLYMRPMPPSAGFSFYPENIGDMINRGVELDLNVTAVARENLRVDLNLNLTHYTNEILSLPVEDGIRSGNQWLMEGGSIYDYYLIQSAGLDSIGQQLYLMRPELLDELGDPMYDEDGSPLFDESEWVETADYEEANELHNRVNMGSALPDLFGGFSLNITYRNFDLGVMTNFQLGGLVLDNVYQNMMHAGEPGQNWHRDIQDAWTPDNTDTDVPRLNVSDLRSANETTDRFLVDASFFNIRNITLGYSFKPNAIPGVSRLRIYGVVDNVWLFSHRQGLDPRQAMSGATGFNYSPIRSFSIGLNISI